MKRMDKQDKFSNLCQWAEQMIRETGKHYRKWKEAQEPEEKQEMWFRYNGRFVEMTAALERIWASERATEEIKRRLWGLVNDLTALIGGKTGKEKDGE